MARLACLDRKPVSCAKYIGIAEKMAPTERGIVVRRKEDDSNLHAASPLGSPSDVFCEGGE